MLGALLEKSGVPYTIFERAATVKPLGMLPCHPVLLLLWPLLELRLSLTLSYSMFAPFF